VGGVVVGHGNLGQVVPPLAGRALREEGMRVGEQGGVGKWFLGAISNAV
jgi:hypothetical protein